MRAWVFQYLSQEDVDVSSIFEDRVVASVSFVHTIAFVFNSEDVYLIVVKKAYKMVRLKCGFSI